MDILRYTEKHKEACINIFRSNIEIYFAEWEFSLFEEYLKKYAKKSHFYVLIEHDQIVACGGFEKNEGVANLTWGMVDRHYHQQHLGEKLLMFRLETIKQEYGSIPIEIDTSQHTRGFFEKYGFVTTRVEENGYCEDLHKVFMTYTVS